MPNLNALAKHVNAYLYFTIFKGGKVGKENPENQVAVSCSPVTIR